MIDFYQRLPQVVDSVAFSVVGFSIHWYALMWLLAFGVGYVLLVHRVKNGEGMYSVDDMQDLVTNSLIGALVGGRIGYVIFYDLGYYISHPLQIISPYDFVTNEWIGIYGMSYHGGLIGVVFAILWTAHKIKKDPLTLSDFIVPVIPIGYFFGRIGNFLNGELYGRVTDVFWGMNFDNSGFLRHPSQLYEAFFEGIVLFIILWSLRNIKMKKGFLSIMYLVGYAIIRFFVEFFREPDAHLGTFFWGMTMGQFLSLFMVICAVGVFLWINKDQKKEDHLSQKKKM
jgi:phosphatidylglycerol---prolipoprotein diacylglyceryl transferase